MTIRTSVINVKFARSFRLGNMDEAYPPGVYEVETDEEMIDTVVRLAYRRVATRIWLERSGTTQVLLIDPTELAAALAADAA